MTFSQSYGVNLARIDKTPEQNTPTPCGELRALILKRIANIDAAIAQITAMNSEPKSDNK